MSKITTIYDTVRTRLATVLPDHKELINPRNIELNNTLYLCKGQGVLFGQGINTERELSCRMSISRDLQVTITRQILGTDRDIALKVSAEKAILEDQFLVINDLEKDPDLDGTLAGIKYINDTGIQEVYFDQVQYLMIQTLFQFEYLETLS